MTKLLLHGIVERLDFSGFALDDHVRLAIPQNHNVGPVRLALAGDLDLALDLKAINPNAIRADQLLKAPLPDRFLGGGTTWRLSSGVRQQRRGTSRRIRRPRNMPGLSFGHIHCGR